MLPRRFPQEAAPQNIVIGGAACALPPVVGWVAATGNVELKPLILFLIIFLWTPPHFWALSLNLAGEYARAGVPMLPVVAGDDPPRPKRRGSSQGGIHAFPPPPSELFIVIRREKKAA
jgi:hypothetical protein